jgi:hypothetical protein
MRCPLDTGRNTLRDAGTHRVLRRVGVWEGGGLSRRTGVVLRPPPELLPGNRCLCPAPAPAAHLR